MSASVGLPCSPDGAGNLGSLSPIAYAPAWVIGGIMLRKGLAIMALVTIPAVNGGTFRQFVRDFALSFAFCTALAVVLTALFWGL